MGSTFKITWIDLHEEPVCPPNPAYPKGIDVVAVRPGMKSCRTALPYPAKRCGRYIVQCTLCGLQVMISTAGRPDDPRSLRIACMRTLH